MGAIIYAPAGTSALAGTSGLIAKGEIDSYIGRERVVLVSESIVYSAVDMRTVCQIILGASFSPAHQCVMIRTDTY